MWLKLDIDLRGTRACERWKGPLAAPHVECKKKIEQHAIFVRENFQEKEVRVIHETRGNRQELHHNEMVCVCRGRTRSDSTASLTSTPVS